MLGRSMKTDKSAVKGDCLGLGASGNIFQWSAIEQRALKDELELAKRKLGLGGWEAE